MASKLCGMGHTTKKGRTALVAPLVNMEGRGHWIGAPARYHVAPVWPLAETAWAGNSANPSGICNPVSTGKTHNVTRFRGRVFSTAGLVSFNDKSTRYTANLQILKAPSSVIDQGPGTWDLIAVGFRKTST